MHAYILGGITHCMPAGHRAQCASELNWQGRAHVEGAQVAPIPFMCSVIKGNQCACEVCKQDVEKEQLGQ